MGLLDVGEVISLTTRRKPVYFVVDASETMAGEPHERVVNTIKQLIQAMCQSPLALEHAFVSVIQYAEKTEKLLPLTEV